MVVWHSFVFSNTCMEQWVNVYSWMNQRFLHHGFSCQIWNYFYPKDLIHAKIRFVYTSLRVSYSILFISLVNIWTVNSGCLWHLHHSEVWFKHWKVFWFLDIVLSNKTYEIYKLSIATGLFSYFIPNPNKYRVYTVIPSDLVFHILHEYWYYIVWQYPPKSRSHTTQLKTDMHMTTNGCVFDNATTARDKISKGHHWAIIT